MRRGKKTGKRGEGRDDGARAEATVARGIDGHEKEPGKGKRQEVRAPEEMMGRVSEYSGELKKDAKKE